MPRTRKTSTRRQLEEQQVSALRREPAAVQSTEGSSPDAATVSTQNNLLSELIKLQLQQAQIQQQQLQQLQQQMQQQQAQQQEVMIEVLRSVQRLAEKESVDRVQTSTLSNTGVGPEQVGSDQSRFDAIQGEGEISPIINSQNLNRSLPQITSVQMCSHSDREENIRFHGRENENVVRDRDEELLRVENPGSLRGSEILVLNNQERELVARLLSRTGGSGDVIPVNSVLDSRSQNKTNQDRDAHSGSGIINISLKPSTYDGNTSWSVYERQFRMIARSNNWGTREKAASLTASLRGSALAVLGSLSDSDAEDYDKICSALKLRFGEEHLTKLYFTQFENRSQNRNEDLATLGHDIERLSRLAMPECSEKGRDQVACAKFINAIGDVAIKHQLRLTAPSSLHQAIIKGLELEAINKIDARPDKIRQLEVELTSEKSSKDTNFRCNEKLNKPTFICRFCKKPGHDTNHCFTLKRRNERNASTEDNS